MADREHVREYDVENWFNEKCRNDDVFMSEFRDHYFNEHNNIDFEVQLEGYIAEKMPSEEERTLVAMAVEFMRDNPC